MPEFRKYPRGTTRQIIDYASLLAKLDTQECDVLCIPTALTDIIRKLLKDRGLWRTTYAITYSETGYTIPTQSEFVPIAQVIYEFLEDTSIMGCTFDELANAVIYLADKLAAKSCCASTPGECGPGTGGAGGEETTPTTEVDDGETAPAGFDTYGDYTDYKCNVATYIISALATDVTQMTTINLASLTVSGVAAALGFLLLTPVPGAFIVAIAGLLLIMASAASTLATLQDALDNAADDLICVLNNAADAATAKSNLLLALDTALQSETSDTVILFEANALLSYLVTLDVVNKLFLLDDTISYPEASCDCPTESTPQVWYYADTQYIETPVSGADQGGGVWRFTIPANINYGDGYNGVQFIVRAVSGYVIDTITFASSDLTFAGPTNDVLWWSEGPANGGSASIADVSALNTYLQSYSLYKKILVRHVSGASTITVDISITVTEASE